jgi:hypothetical protein
MPLAIHLRAACEGLFELETLIAALPERHSSDHPIVRDRIAGLVSGNCLVGLKSRSTRLLRSLVARC